TNGPGNRCRDSIAHTSGRPTSISPAITDYASISNVGQSDTYGELRLRNTANTPATVIGVSIVQTNPNLELLGVLATDPRKLDRLIGHEARSSPYGLEEVPAGRIMKR
ncbi:MAG: hypothetical protein M3432_04885, partial [Chloroflexota bacterium]|nr:hypothetical protein [Chloroflexota bacterium]